MIASAQTLRKLRPVSPFVEKTIEAGMSYGLSVAGYDIRVREDRVVIPDGRVSLVSSLEEFNMPLNLLGIVHDKSTWARKGLLVQNTVIEPGWKGYLTLEITNQSNAYITLREGMPIAQIIFHFLDEATDTPYTGKYQNQPAKPIGAILE